MKTCPSCHRNYEDESLVFCLDDGTRLVRAGAADANATWNLPAPGPTVASPRPAQPTAQSTIVASPEQFQRTPPPVGSDGGESRSGILPWVFAIVLVLAASGVLIAWLMTRGRGDVVGGSYPTPTPAPSIMQPTPTATAEVDRTPTPDERATATPKSPSQPPPPPRPKPAFAVLDNMTFHGSRITYYQSPSFASCQADCAGNANCKGLTWIRPGAYNPSDPGMCYLMSALTDRVPHSCCISGVKN